MGAPKLESKLEPKHESHAHLDDDDHEEGGHKKVEEGEGPWLVSYADLMTLLMGFFALISSMSSVNQQKLEQVRESAAETFGGEYKQPYKELGEALQKFVKDNKLEDKVKLKIGIQGVEMTFTGTMFFDSGNYVVKSEAAELMKKLAQTIKGVPSGYRTLIEGHTDSAPINHPIVASNWELSGLRASRIAQLFEQNGFAKDSLTIIGWGDNRPIVADRDANGNYIPEAMAQNRRVVIYVYDRKLSDDPIKR